MGVDVTGGPAREDAEDLPVPFLAVGPGDRPERRGPPRLGEPLLHVQLSTSVADGWQVHALILPSARRIARLLGVALAGCNAEPRPPCSPFSPPTGAGVTGRPPASGWPRPRASS